LSANWWILVSVCCRIWHFFRGELRHPYRHRCTVGAYPNSVWNHCEQQVLVNPAVHSLLNQCKFSHCCVLYCPLIKDCLFKRPQIVLSGVITASSFLPLHVTKKLRMIKV
jgi:hypothetical protein